MNYPSLLSEVSCIVCNAKISFFYVLLVLWSLDICFFILHVFILNCIRQNMIMFYRDLLNRYSKVGFAGNVEPCFILPTVVAINDSFVNQSRSSSKGNWSAQYSAGVMADLDFFIGDDAISRSRSSSTYNLSYPIQHGQVNSTYVI